MAPDAELDQTPGTPFSGTYSGFDAAVESMRDWMSAFEHFDAKPSDVIDAGEQVIVAWDESGTARGGSVELRETFYMLYTLREGKIVRLAWFADRADAFKAAGLSS